LVATAIAVMNAGCDLSLHERYNMGGNRPIYVMLPLGSKDESQLYNTCATDSRLKGVEVITKYTLFPGGEMTLHGTGMTTEEIIVDSIVVGVPNQYECQSVTYRVSLGGELVKANSVSLNLSLVRYEFDVDVFDQNIGNEQNVDENDESSSSDSDEENIEALFNTTHDVPVAIGGKDNESNM
jgi:hypothetical protein